MGKSASNGRFPVNSCAYATSILKNTGTLKLFFRTFFGGAFLAEAMQQITAALEQKAMLF